MNVTHDLPSVVSAHRASRQVKKKILLADDDPAIRKLLARLLADEGYVVSPAANGDEVLKLAAAVQFDLVLLDLNMPGKDGWETFEQLTLKDPLLPVIVITARSNQLFHTLASGVGALIEKPLDFAMLFRTIRDLLEEPPEFRHARMSGLASKFHYVPPKVASCPHPAG
jgi:DNA-binding response OmpR family regulator